MPTPKERIAAAYGDGGIRATERRASAHREGDNDQITALDALAIANRISPTTRMQLGYLKSAKTAFDETVDRLTED